jgi:hypothetical protein
MEAKVENGARVKQVAEERYRLTWYFERDGKPQVHCFPIAGCLNTMHHIEILEQNGYSVEPAALVEELRAKYQQAMLPEGGKTERG